MATQGSGRGRGGKPRQESGQFPAETGAGTTSGGGFEAQGGSTQGRQKQSWSGTIRQAAGARMSDQKHRASEQIDHVAHALRQTTESLRGQGRGAIADYADQAAQKLEQLSHRIDEKDLQEMLDDVQKFARRQPTLFIGAAFGVGLLGARFLKSSRERSGERPASGPQYQPPYETGSIGTAPDLLPRSDLPGGGPIS